MDGVELKEANSLNIKVVNAFNISRRPTPRISTLLHLFECSEDLSELVLGDAHARVLNGQEDVLAVLTDAPGNGDGSGAGELGCRGMEVWGRKVIGKRGDVRETSSNSISREAAQCEGHESSPYALLPILYPPTLPPPHTHTQPHIPAFPIRLYMIWISRSPSATIMSGMLRT